MAMMMIAELTLSFDHFKQFKRSMHKKMAVAGMPLYPTKPTKHTKQRLAKKSRPHLIDWPLQ